MLNIVSNFSNRNNGKFNNDFLLNMRRNDSMIMYLDEACKAISNQLANSNSSSSNVSYNVVYNGYYFNDNRNKELEMNQGKEDKTSTKKSKAVTIHINDTYAQEAIFDFDCTFNGQTIKHKMSIWIPMLIDASHFYIRGNKYSAPLQMIDAMIFTKRNILILKTMTRAIKFERSKETITDIYGNKYFTNSINIYISTKKVSFLLYYFSYFGFFKTLEYFGVEKMIKIYSGDVNTGVPENSVIFKLGGSVYMAVDKEQFLNKNNIVLRTFVTSIQILAKRSIVMDFLRDPVRWSMYLGETINIQKSLDRGEALIKTFIFSYDFRTKTIVNKLIDDGNSRDNIFAMVRWIFVNYSKLHAKDDGLQNKRIRLNEYLISPFIKRFSDNMYRFINTPNKSKNLNTLLNVFKLKSNIIIHSIIGKIAPQKTGLNIAKFSSESNDNALLNSILNITKAGPGSPMEKSKIVGINHRQISMDSIGSIDIIGGTSNNDPGIAGHICPCADYDMDKQIFNIDPTLLRR